MLLLEPLDMPEIRSHALASFLFLGAALASTGAAAQEVEAPCPDAAEEGEAESTHTIALSVSVLPRVDGWDPTHGHRSGWGLAGGIDLSPWDSDSEIHIEVTYLTNGHERLISFDLGLKVPFHSGLQWDVHGVVGPALAYEHFQQTHEDGSVSSEGALVVGMIAGVGTTYWFHRHVGATLDLNYRILGGEGIAHRLFSAIGLASRW
ncbi:MAG: hypothetical protein CMN30_20100 [Sandaracinus sp.]|nr:hypothetical protein [Sandaracinus sp.]|tara:strand:- start:1137 stop:1754 length:618 start_codon:yes stop_codon:yes gene_type:complete